MGFLKNSTTNSTCHLQSALIEVSLLKEVGGKRCRPDGPLDPRAQHPVQWLDTMEMDTCWSPIPAAPSEHPENLQKYCPNARKAIFAHTTYPTKLLVTALSNIFIKDFHKHLFI